MTARDLSIDVVMPVRNGARYVAEAVLSALNQDDPASRVIVVDDGSDDNTPAILADLVRTHGQGRLTVISTKPCGVSHARNVGIKAASASYVAFLDADDIWAPGKLRAQRAELLKHPDCEVVYCGHDHVDQYGAQLLMPPSLPDPLLQGDVFAAIVLRERCPTGSCSTVVANRALVVAVGGFDERLRFSEDWDLWGRLAQRTRFCAVLDRPLASLRHHGGSATRSGDPAIRGRQQILQKWSILDRWWGTLGTLPPATRRRQTSVMLEWAWRQGGVSGLRALLAEVPHTAPRFAARYGGFGVRLLMVIALDVSIHFGNRLLRSLAGPAHSR